MSKLEGYQKCTGIIFQGNNLSALHEESLLQRPGYYSNLTRLRDQRTSEHV